MAEAQGINFFLAMEGEAHVEAEALKGPKSLSRVRSVSPGDLTCDDVVTVADRGSPNLVSETRARVRGCVESRVAQ